MKITEKNYRGYSYEIHEDDKTVYASMIVSPNNIKLTTPIFFGTNLDKSIDEAEKLIKLEIEGIVQMDNLAKLEYTTGFDSCYTCNSYTDEGKKLTEAEQLDKYASLRRDQYKPVSAYSSIGRKLAEREAFERELRHNIIRETPIYLSKTEYEKDILFIGPWYKKLWINIKYKLKPWLYYRFIFDNRLNNE